MRRYTGSTICHFSDLVCITRCSSVPITREDLLCSPKSPRGHAPLLGSEGCRTHSLTATMASASEVEEELVPKRNSTSVVWNYFGFSGTDKDQTNIICKICRTEHLKATDGNTTGLRNHLKCKHPKQYMDVERSASQRLQSCAARCINSLQFQYFLFASYE